MANLPLPEVAPRLQPHELDVLMLYVLRLPDLFSLAVTTVQPEFFSAFSEPHLMALWLCAREVLDEFGMHGLFDNPIQACELLRFKLTSYCKANPKSVNDGYQDRLFNAHNGLLKYVYVDHLPEHLLSAHGHKLFRRFVEERYVQDPLRAMMTQAGDATVLNLPVFLQQVKDRQHVVASLAENPVDVVCPPDWTPTPLHKFSTGLTFLDKFMNGGHAAGETYGVLGAFGAGKTTLAVQLVVGGATQQRVMVAAAAEAGETYHPKKWYFFHYEGGKDEMRVRLLSYLCEIDKDLLEEWNFAGMSTSSTLKPYETLRWSKLLHANEEVDGERERWEKRRCSINACFGMIDMSGSPANPKRGQGYIPEVAAIIERDLQEESQRRGHTVEAGGVVLDYAGLCVKRHLASLTRPNPDDYYRLLSDIGEDTRRQVAVPFRCPFWVMHQLSGQSNKKTSSARQGHADAAGSASFAENLYFCFALGTKDPEYGSVLFTCSKARRSEIGVPPRLEFDVPVAALRESDLIENTSGQLRRKSDAKTTM